MGFAAIACGGVEERVSGEKLRVGHSAAEALREELQANINIFALALLSHDEESVRSALTRERLDRVDGRNLMTPFIEKERGKLVRALGSEVAFGEGLVVVVMDGYPGSPMVSITVSHAGVVLPKQLYFVLEADGIYRFSGQMPKRGFENYQVDIDSDIVEMSSALFSISTYNIRNNDATVTVEFRCKETSTGSFGSWKSVSPTSTRNNSCADSCSSFGYDGSHFEGRHSVNGAFDSADSCDYNSWGNDWIYNGDHWNCFDQC